MCFCLVSRTELCNFAVVILFTAILLKKLTIARKQETDETLQPCHPVTLLPCYPVTQLPFNPVTR